MKFFSTKKKIGLGFCVTLIFFLLNLFTIDLIHIIVIDANGLRIPPIGSFILQMITIEIHTCPTIYIETK